MRYLLDTWIWVEYLRGSSKGKILKELFDDGDNIFYTLQSTLSELKGFCLKNGLEEDKIFTVVRNKSMIRSIIESHWLDAAKIRYEQRKTKKQFGIIDALLVAFQQDIQCKIISGDHHFKGIKNVLFVS